MLQEYDRMIAEQSVAPQEVAHRVCRALAFQDLYNDPRIAQIIDNPCDLELDPAQRAGEKKEGKAWEIILEVAKQILP